MNKDEKQKLAAVVAEQVLDLMILNGRSRWEAHDLWKVMQIRARRLGLTLPKTKGAFLTLLSLAGFTMDEIQHFKWSRKDGRHGRGTRRQVTLTYVNC